MDLEEDVKRKGPISEIIRRLKKFESFERLVRSGAFTGATGAGTGDVVGPAGAVDQDIAIFSGGTGKLIADSGVLISGLGDVDGPAGAVDQRIAIFSGASGKLIADGGILVSSVVVDTEIREKLVAARTYYVRTDGSDSNTGLANTAGGAFLTIQKAIDTAAGLDLSLYAVTVQVGAGTYTGTVVLKSYIGVGPINILGDETTPANCIISVTSANAVSGTGVKGVYTLRGFELRTTTTGSSITVASGTQLTIQNIRFGATAAGYIHISAATYAIVTITGNITITAGTDRHLFASTFGTINYSGTITVTLTGTPAFTYFAVAQRVGQIVTSSVPTFSGGATGTRYIADTNSNIYTAGGGANFFPGNVAGSTASGGQYT